MDRADIQESRRFLSPDKSAFYTILSQKITNLSNLQLKIGNFANVVKLPIFNCKLLKFVKFFGQKRIKGRFIGR